MWGRLRSLSRASSRSRRQEKQEEHSSGFEDDVEQKLSDGSERPVAAVASSTRAKGNKKNSKSQTQAPPLSSDESMESEMETDEEMPRQKPKQKGGAQQGSRGRPPAAPSSSNKKIKKSSSQGTETQSRSRSRSFGRMFRRTKSLAKNAGDLDSLASSVEGSVASEGGSETSSQAGAVRKPRSLSNPLRMFRSLSRKSMRSDNSLPVQAKSTNSFSDVDSETGSASKHGTALEGGRKANPASKERKTKRDSSDMHSDQGSSCAEVDGEEAGVPGKGHTKKKKKLRLKKNTQRIIKRLRTSSALRFALSKPSDDNNGVKGKRAQASAAQAASPAGTSVGSPRGEELEAASFPFRHLFSRADVLYFKSIHETTTTMFETLSELIGEGINAMLLARLAEMINDQDDLFRALAALRSTSTRDRALMLFHMHDLSRTGSGTILRQDFCTVLRHTAAADLLGDTADDTQADWTPQEAEECLERVGHSMAHRIRLERFYSLHAPDKLTRVAAILEKYAGREDSLWRKLEKQYVGTKVPCNNEIMPVLMALDAVDAIVQDAFARCDSSTEISFEEFIIWAGRLDERFRCDDIDQEPSGCKTTAQTPWRQLCNVSTTGVGSADTNSSAGFADGLGRGQEPMSADCEGWLRVAFLDTSERGKKQNKVRLSELSWRRRWCQVSVTSQGSAILELRKSHDDAPFETLDMSLEVMQVDSVERPGHKHRWTALVDHRVLVQTSRASSNSFDDWLFALRAATHFEIKSQLDSDLEESGLFSDSSDEEELDNEESSGPVDGVASSFELRVKAFYLENNSAQLGKASMKQTLERYRGREDKLVAMLEKRYPGSKVPTYVQAQAIIKDNSKSQGKTAISPRSEYSRADTEVSASNSEVGPLTPLTTSPRPKSPDYDSPISNAVGSGTEMVKDDDDAIEQSDDCSESQFNESESEFDEDEDEDEEEDENGYEIDQERDYNEHDDEDEEANSSQSEASDEEGEEEEEEEEESVHNYSPRSDEFFQG